MKLIIILLLFSLSYCNAQKKNISDDLIKNTINGKTWKLSTSPYCLTFKNNNCFYHHRDSTIILENGYPYTVNNGYIKIVPHVLEQAQYKVIDIVKNELILDIYFLKLTHKEIEAGKPKSIRLKKIHSNLRYIKLP
jgi:hypothetical protein